MIALRIAGPETLETLGTCQSGGPALGLAAADLANPTNRRVCTELQYGACSGGSDPHPKKVVKNGKNGSDHMAWWVSLHGKEFDSAKSGVEVASNRRIGRTSERS